MDREPEPARPPRRARYRGKHPRGFAEKYKERNPQLYPETVGRVLASGKTPAGSHVPVMTDECLAALSLSPGMTGVDATLGHGGHAARILQKICPGGKLVGLDIDPHERLRTWDRLRAEGWGTDCFEAVASNYAGVAKVLERLGIGKVDFIFADLGCSSMQLDDPARGFSFKHDGPLDMRMDPRRGLPAADWLARVKPAKLEEILHENADEPHAATLARALAGGNFPTTRQLAAAVRAALGPQTAADSADLTVRRVFQAIRIEVNDEFSALDAFLRMAPECLKPGGRLVVLTFHSGEDRRVKKAFQAGLRGGVFGEISDGVGVAGEAERRANPRSIPAKLRRAVARMDANT